MMRFGIDLGGTKIEIIAIDPQGAVRLRRRVATPKSDYDATIREIQILTLAAEQELGITATVGVATPGAISPATGLMKNANSTCLNSRPLDRDLAAALARPVRIANDADCFALSEATDGAGQGEPTVFGVILGTGVGGGFVVNGRLLSGPSAIAGEWGHNPMPWPEIDEWPGPACYCGRTGCIETLLSGPAFEEQYAAATGQLTDAGDIVSLAAYLPAAARILERYQERLARALAHVINILDPHAIVLGGGLSEIESLYTTLPIFWKGYVFSDHIATKLVKAAHGPSSGVRGAAWLWPADKLGTTS